MLYIFYHIANKYVLLLSQIVFCKFSESLSPDKALHKAAC